MRIYKIDKLEKGILGMMARPRGGDWLEDEMLSLQREHVTIVVNLLEASEIYDLNIQAEQELCEKLNIEFIHFPIRDRTIPENENAFLKLITELINLLNANHFIVIHCRMGIGRTAILTAGILLKLGFDRNIFFLI